MSVELLTKYFLITYDSGDEEKPQTRKVPVELYENEEEFRKNIISFKCSHCGFESSFDCVEKESDKIG